MPVIHSIPAIHSISIGAWNIGGIKSKLEDPDSSNKKLQRASSFALAAALVKVSLHEPESWFHLMNVRLEHATDAEMLSNRSKICHTNPYVFQENRSSVEPPRKRGSISAEFPNDRKGRSIAKANLDPQPHGSVAEALIDFIAGRQ